MQFRHRLFSLIILLALMAPALNAVAQKLDYTVDLRTTAQHKVHVTLHPIGLGVATMSFQMPAWAPGAYAVTHYGRFVENFTALDKKHKPLDVVRIDSDRWEIHHAKAISEISYDIRDSHKDPSSLYFALAHFDTTICFVNATALFGYVNDRKDVRATVTYDKPDNWQLATALDPITISGHPQQTGEFHHTTFSAKDYDVLADAPLMAAPQFQTKTFTDGPASYDLVLLSNKPFPIDSLAPYVEKIVHAETEFFHDTPFKHYSFLVYAPTFAKVPSMAEGALEHANSSDYLLINMPWVAFKGFGISIFSHEFFHLWNVKRIHSTLLGPFDYTKRVKTTSLWMAEGITDYYAHTLLTRAHILPVPTFYNDIKNWMQELAAHGNHDTSSLEQLSIAESDFHLDDAGMFYIKGPLVAMMLDIEIRKRSDNNHSLDEVMRTLYADAKQGKTFTDGELFHKVEKIVGLDLSSFYHRYIAGTDSIPVDSYLADIGLLRTPDDTGSGQKLNLSFSPSGALTISEIDPNSSTGLAGIKKGDEIVAINGKKLTMSNLKLLTDLANESTAKIDVIREGKPLSIVADLQAARTKALKLVKHPYYISPNSTPLQDAMRNQMIEQM